MLFILTISPILLIAALALPARFARPTLRRAWLTSIGIMLGCLAIDLLMLLLLPLLNLSFGPITSIFFFAAARLLILVTGLVLLLLRPAHAWTDFTLRLFPAFQIILLCLIFYGMYIEPFMLGVTHLPVQAPAFFPDRPLRILQISDLHVEHTTIREQDVLSKTAAIQPDIIVLTGDYLNIDYNSDPASITDAHALLAQLHAPYGVFAIAGTPAVDHPEILPALFNNTEIHLLNDASVSIPFPGGTLAILGINWENGDADQTLAKLLSQVPAHSYTLLLYHAPDQIYAASRAGINLYLAGHTHGGQVRLPIYGAITTLARFGKDFEMGKYIVGPTTLYVCRGVGMEGLSLPRIRFLAPPELVLAELGR